MQIADAIKEADRIIDEQRARSLQQNEAKKAEEVSKSQPLPSNVPSTTLAVAFGAQTCSSRHLSFVFIN